MKSISAFTLIELLVTLIVLCIILIVAVPSMSTMLLNNRLKSSTDLLVNALNYARNTALNNSIKTIVCPFSALNSVTCGTNWSSGWVILSQNAAGTIVLLQSQQSTAHDPVLTGTSANITFDPHGLTSTPGNFTLCDKRGGALAQSIEVKATGFVQSGTTAGQAVWNNSILVCPGDNKDG